MFFFFFKQKTAYEMRISDWSSDVCSSDLIEYPVAVVGGYAFAPHRLAAAQGQFAGNVAARHRDHLDRQRKAPQHRYLLAGIDDAHETLAGGGDDLLDRKSTRLNSSH